MNIQEAQVLAFLAKSGQGNFVRAAMCMCMFVLNLH